jgi:hypothetical protein
MWGVVQRLKGLLTWQHPCVRVGHRPAFVNQGADRGYLSLAVVLYIIVSSMGPVNSSMVSTDVLAVLCMQYCSCEFTTRCTHLR